MKLLCKRNLFECTQLTGHQILSKGTFYECPVAGHTDQYGRTHKDFSRINDTNFYYYSNHPNLYYIWDYFYTPQEERKFKLQKLNQIR